MRILLLMGQLWLLGWALAAGPAAHAQVPNWRLAFVSAFDTIAANQAANYHVVRAMTTDSSGNVYQTGYYRGRVRFGATQLVSQGRYDAFVACWNPATAQYVWAASAGGPGSVEPTDIAVNSRGVFITGSLTSGNRNLPSGSSYPATFGSVTLTTIQSDFFVAKLTLGGSFVWAKQSQVSNVATGQAVAVVGANVYVAGTFVDSAITLGSTTLTQTVLYNSGDSFVVKLTDNGPTAAFGWVVPLTGAGYELVNKLAAVGSNVYVAGTYNSLATSIGPYVLTNLPTGGTPNQSIMVAKIADQGAAAQIAWAWQGNGSTDSRLALAATGTSLYLSSSLTYQVTFGNVTLVPIVPNQPFVLRLDDRGTQAAMGWATLLGGPGRNSMAGLVARGGTLYMLGHFAGQQQLGSTLLTAPLNPGSGLVQNDVFLTKMTDTGSTLGVDWAIQGGGINHDYAYGITLAGDSVFASGRADVPSIYGTQVISGTSNLPVMPMVTYLATVKAGTGPPPSLTSFSPGAGPVGTTVTLNGQNLTQVAGVSFNGVAAPNFTANPVGTSLTVQVPTGASSGVLRVSTRGGTARSVGSFLVQGVLSASSAQISHNIVLIPNPARESVQVQLLAAGVARPVQVLDALGREVYRSTLAAQATGLLVPTGTLVPGCYTVRCLDAIGRLVLE